MKKAIVLKTILLVLFLTITACSSESPEPDNTPNTETPTTENNDDENDDDDVVIEQKSNNDTGVYIAISGFNETITETPNFIKIDDINGSFEAENFIDDLSLNENTGLFYAMDKGIDKITTNENNFPKDLSKVFLITFTDGVDNVSGILANKGDNNDVKDIVKNKLETTKLNDSISINSYTVGVGGGTNTNQLQSDLRELISGSGKFIFANGFNDLGSEFSNIAGDLTTVENAEQKVSAIMPQTSTGTVVRWVFDNKANAEDSEYFIQGTFNRDNGNLQLTNIIYSNIETTENLKTLEGTQEGVASVKFDFNGIILCELPDFLRQFWTENISFWTKRDNGTWQQDSESGTASVENISLKKESVAVMLVLDASTSLGTNFFQVKESAKNFITSMVSGYENPTAQPDYTCTGNDVQFLQLSIDNELYDISFNSENKATVQLNGYIPNFGFDERTIPTVNELIISGGSTTILQKGQKLPFEEILFDENISYSFAIQSQEGIRKEFIIEFKQGTTTEILTFSGNSIGNGVISPFSSACSRSFSSGTENLSIEVTQTNGVITKGTYSFNIVTSVGLFIEGNPQTCTENLKTFNENHSGNLIIDGNNISFDTTIGNSVELQDVGYAFSGDISGTLFNRRIIGDIIHTSEALVSNQISYSIFLNLQQ